MDGTPSERIYRMARDLEDMAGQAKRGRKDYALRMAILIGTIEKAADTLKEISKELREKE